MAKKSGKAKAAGKKSRSTTKTRKAKAGKKAAAKKLSAKKRAPKKKAAKKVRVRKAAAPLATHFETALAPAPTVAPRRAVPRPAALADPKNGAVNSCVNALMNAARPGWTDNGKMDADYQYNNHSMRAFLSTIKDCLQAKHFTLNMNDDDFVNKCVSAAVFQLKLLINGRTT